MWDETSNVAVTGFADLKECVEKDAVQVVLCDVHYWGGLRAVQHLGKLCKTFGLGLSMHSNSHLGISLMAMAHAAAVTPHLTYACDTHYPWSATSDEVVEGGRVPIVVAARAGPGRVLLVGYEDTWRWRMVGADGAPEAHRAWWSALVTGVAHAPVVPLSAPFVDEAPLAAAIGELGLPADRTSAGSRAPFPLDAVLFAVLLLAMLGEWLSRRLRGLR